MGETRRLMGLELWRAIHGGKVIKKNGLGGGYEVLGRINQSERDERSRRRLGLLLQEWLTLGPEKKLRDCHNLLRSNAKGFS